MSLRGSGCTTGCSDSLARRCPSRSGTSSRSATRSRNGAASRCWSTSSTAQWRKPVDFTDEVLAAGGRPGGGVPQRLPFFVGSCRGRGWERFAAALDDDFSTPEALAVMHEWRDHELLARALDVFGLGSLAETG